MIESRHQNPLRLSLQNTPQSLFIFLESNLLAFCLKPTSPIPSQRLCKKDHQGDDQQEIDQADSPEQAYVTTVTHWLDSGHTHPYGQAGASLYIPLCALSVRSVRT